VLLDRQELLFDPFGLGIERHGVERRPQEDPVDRLDHLRRRAGVRVVGLGLGQERQDVEPAPAVIHPLATAILDWAQEQRCSLLVSPEGLVVESAPGAPRKGRGGLADVKVFGIASTRKARDLYIDPNTIPFNEGVITGIAGVLLNEGRRRGFDVLTFLAEAQADYPDARAAAKVIETINRILLRSPLDPVPLYAEAERIEQQLLLIQRRAAERARPEAATPSSQPMYR